MTNNTKRQLVQQIEAADFFTHLLQHDLFLDFLNELKDLKSMKSTDGRPQFKNAEDDIRQHYIMNDDISLDDVLSGRVGIYNDEDIFNKFLLAVVDSRYTDEDLTNRLVTIINDSLHQEKKELFIYGYGANSRPIYKIKAVEEVYAPKNVAANHISFYVDKHPTGNTRYSSSHKKPEAFPSFVLAFNYTWNDFDAKTRFDLFYYNEHGAPLHVGDVKVISSATEKDQYGNYDVSQFLDDSFMELPSDFCSLGQNQDYYDTLKRLLGKSQMMSALWALQDCALFPVVEDRYSNHPFFYSLVREKEAEDTLNDEAYRLRGENLRERFFFTYHFKPNYADEATDISFNYSNNGDFPNNLYAIIGKNGTGKTQLISRLPLDLEAAKDVNFDHRPSFKKYIAVSYCYYDNFDIPDASATFNYRYCGLLKKMSNGKREIMSKADLQERLIENCKTITKKNRVNEWAEVMASFFPEATIKSWRSGENGQNINERTVIEAANKMSSGESAFLYVFFSIIANIGKYSLILFDEPETHLHPEAITSLTNAIHKLLEAYTSYGLIVTHSPIIVREMLSRNVLVMHRNDDQLLVNRIGIESFGENIAVLSNEIFGNEAVQPHFKKHITKLVSLGADYEDIVKEIQTEGIPLSINLQMYVKNVTKSN